MPIPVALIVKASAREAGEKRGCSVITNFAGMVADVVIFAVMTGLADGIIGWWLGRSKTA